MYFPRKVHKHLAIAFGCYTRPHLKIRVGRAAFGLTAKCVSRPTRIFRCGLITFFSSLLIPLLISTFYNDLYPPLSANDNFAPSDISICNFCLLRYRLRQPWLHPPISTKKIPQLLDIYTKNPQMCRRIPPNTYFMSSRLTYEKRIGQQFILFHRSLKMGVVRFSVSPGHIYIALYRRIKVRMRLKMLSNINF